LEGGQGANQSGGSIAEPEQNRPTQPNYSQTNMGIGTRTVSEPVSPSAQERLVSISVDPFIPRPWKHQSLHPLDQIMYDINTRAQTRSKHRNLCASYAFLSNIESKNVYEGLIDYDWVTTMQEELHQFERNKVWHLEPRPKDISIIGTK